MALPPQLTQSLGPSGHEVGAMSGVFMPSQNGGSPPGPVDVAASGIVLPPKSTQELRQSGFPAVAVAPALVKMATEYAGHQNDIAVLDHLDRAAQEKALAARNALEVVTGLGRGPSMPKPTKTELSLSQAITSILGGVATGGDFNAGNQWAMGDMQRVAAEKDQENARRFADEMDTHKLRVFNAQQTLEQARKEEADARKAFEEFRGTVGEREFKFGQTQESQKHDVNMSAIGHQNQIDLVQLRKKLEDDHEADRYKIAYQQFIRVGSTPEQAAKAVSEIINGDIAKAQMSGYEAEAAKIKAQYAPQLALAGLSKAESDAARSQFMAQPDVLQAEFDMKRIGVSTAQTNAEAALLRAQNGGSSGLGGTDPWSKQLNGAYEGKVKAIANAKAIKDRLAQMLIPGLTQGAQLSGLPSDPETIRTVANGIIDMARTGGASTATWDKAALTTLAELQKADVAIRSADEQIKQYRDMGGHGQSIVDAAVAAKGTPSKFGGYDCSAHVCKSAGIPRQSANQLFSAPNLPKGYQMIDVGPEDLQPGDILFYHIPSDPRSKSGELKAGEATHTNIYIGKSKQGTPYVSNAPGSSKGERPVSNQPLSTRNLIGARRLIPPSAQPKLPAVRPSEREIQVTKTKNGLWESK